jgi:hypothetical protein
LWLGLAK